MTKVEIVAIKVDNHPLLFNIYNRVLINLVTRNVGGTGILDIELAIKINTL